MKDSLTIIQRTLAELADEATEACKAVAEVSIKLELFQLKPTDIRGIACQLLQIDRNPIVIEKVYAHALARAVISAVDTSLCAAELQDFYQKHKVLRDEEYGRGERWAREQYEKSADRLAKTYELCRAVYPVERKAS